MLEKPMILKNLTLINRLEMVPMATRSGENGVEEAAKAAALIAPCGVDLLDVSGGVGGYVNPDDASEGYMRQQTLAIKKAVNVPVVLAGGFVTVEAADKHLEEGCADIIGVGRAILKDSRWPAQIE